MRADARRSQLVALGMTLFGTRAYEEVQIEEIAQAAGIAKGLLYHYFGSKRGLYLEVVRAASDELLRALEPAPGLSGPENVRRGMLAFFGFVDARAEAYRALMRGGLQTDPEVASLIDGVRDAIVARIAEGAGLSVNVAGADRGELPAPFRVAARSWIGAVEAAALDWLTHRDLSAAELADVLAAGLFGQLAMASSLAPRAGARLELSVGLRMLGSFLGAAAPTRGDATPEAPATDVSSGPASRSASGSRGSRRSRSSRPSP